MAQPITDYDAFFAGAKAAITEAASLKKEEEELKDQEAKGRADLEAEQRALRDIITLTIRQRTAEISKTYDEQIAKGNEEMRRVTSRRERAKNLGMQERIKEETKPFLAENADLKVKLKELFRAGGVPALYRTRLYYALYFPHKFGQFLTLLLFVLIFFVLIPCGIYFFVLPETYRTTLFLIIIYIVDILVFGGIYTSIGSASKVHYLDTLKRGRDILDQIDRNKKTVKKIRRSVNRDKSEDKYDLASFDDEIAHISQNIADASQKKQEALNNFESVTKHIITDELTANARPRIEQLTSQHAETLRKLQETTSALQQKTLEMADQYEVYLGKEFMTEEKVDALAKIMKTGTAANISEAIEEYRREQDV